MTCMEAVLALRQYHLCLFVPVALPLFSGAGNKTQGSQEFSRLC